MQLVKKASHMLTVDKMLSQLRADIIKFRLVALFVHLHI